MVEHDRITRLESGYRRLRAATITLGVLFVAMLTTLHPRAQQGSDILRVRGIVIEDEAGRPRVVLGAPIPEGRTTTRTGMKILDETGVERLGMNLLSNGSMVLGLDAPAGTGDDGNKERINLVADAKGGASITFKDRRTLVASRMYLGSDNQVVLQFIDYTQQPNRMRTLGLTGDIFFPPRTQ
jgi:hypothetical protein